MHVIRKVYSSMLEKKITAEEESLGALETTFQKIKIVTGLTDVDEMKGAAPPPPRMPRSRARSSVRP